MRLNRWTGIAGLLVLAACARSVSSVRQPLGAQLVPGARTGVPVPLRVDPNARVTISNAAGLPAASFHEAQAAHGRQIYEQSCGNCHEPGQLIGQGFVENWNDRRVYDLYALVRSTMPLDNPGGMKDQEYLDVIAYLLQANKAPAGADSLRADTLMLRTTRIAVSAP